jgi:hypothetical protein
MDATVLRTWRRIIALRGGVEVYGGHRPQFYRYPNGAVVWIVGLDNPDKILSGEFGAAYVNQAEELSLNDWETLSTRVTGRGSVNPRPMLFGDCNPSAEDHWIKRRADGHVLTLLDSRHEDNPTLYDESGRITAQGQRTMAVLDALTGVRYQRLRLGLWVGAEGQYYTQWDTVRHVCDPFPIPADWRMWGGFDYGYRHLTACYLLAEHDGVVYVVDEHCASQWLVGQHAEALAAMVARHGRTLRGLRIVAGHDVFAQRGDAKAQTIAQQYAAHGITLERAQIDRINRAQYLGERLGNPDAGVAPMIQVFATCRRLIATIPALLVDPNRPEDVLKTDVDANGNGGDDCYDAMSYGLMEANRPPPRRAVRSRIEETWG